jgi:hypothetical protein
VPRWTRRYISQQTGVGRNLQNIFMTRDIETAEVAESMRCRQIAYGKIWQKDNIAAWAMLALSGSKTVV